MDQSEPDQQHDASKAFFPLQSSVELFKESAEIGAVARAKEASLLYDKVIFETGLWEMLITPTGTSGTWTRDKDLSWERIELARQTGVVGKPMYLALGKQPDYGTPAEEMHVVVEGAVSERHVAEFYTGILGELASVQPDWVLAVELGGTDVPTFVDDDLKEEIRRRNFRNLGHPELMPDVEPFQRAYIYKSFNRDTVLATALESTFQASSMYEPMIRDVYLNEAGIGTESLRILVPNVSNIPWEAVAEFREHPAFDEARGHFREFELLALRADPADAIAYLRRVGQETQRAMFSAIEEYRPNLPEDLAQQAASTAISYLPGVGPVLAALSDAGTALQDHNRFKRSWIGAVMKLTRSP